MNRFISKFFLTFALGATCVALVAGPLAVQTAHAADPFGLETTRVKTQFKGVKKTLPQAIGSILSVALSMIGFIFLGLALYAGFKWMTARGEAKEVTTARDTLINAVIGIILIVAAYSLTNFIFTDVITKIN